MSVVRIQAIWTGVTGLPGYSNFHFDGGDVTSTDTIVTNAAKAVGSFLGNLKAYLPLAVRINIRPTAEVFTLEGLKVAERQVTGGPAEMVGESTGAYAGGVGAVVHWKTGNYWNGRPIAGRTFLVPLAGAFDNTGTLSPVAQTAIQNAAAYMRTSVGVPPFVVWQVRPGSAAMTPVSSFVVPDRSAVLRSRRS